MWQNLVSIFFFRSNFLPCSERNFSTYSISCGANYLAKIWDVDNDQPCGGTHNLMQTDISISRAIASLDSNEQSLVGALHGPNGLIIDLSSNTLQNLYVTFDEKSDIFSCDKIVCCTRYYFRMVLLIPLKQRRFFLRALGMVIADHYQTSRNGNGQNSYFTGKTQNHAIILCNFQ